MEAGSTPTITDYYSDVDMPSLSEMQVQMQQLVQQGTLSPEQAQAMLVQRSSMEDVNSDPSTKAAQMQALQGLQDVTSSGGLTAMDKAKLQQIFNDEDTKARGSREAILQNAQARGLGGSGIELMSQMQNQQDSATRASQRGMDVAAQAQQRALDALMNQGALAGQMNQQDFSQKQAKANSMDEIAKFNAQNKQQVNLANTGAKNAAQATNLGVKQDVADKNVGLANQQELLNKSLVQQQYDNELKKKQGQTGIAQYNSGAMGDTSKQQAQASNESTKMFMQAAAMMAASDERCKEDVEEFNPSDFLDSLTGYKYNYKDKKDGEGPQVGVMAQDLEKSDLGAKLVVSDEDGKKYVDYAKAGPTMMASLASLNKRMKELEKDKEA
jgi:hypothetical protein